MHSKDLAIGVLSVTAVILFAALVIVQTLAPQAAVAYAQTGNSGDFLVTTTQLDDTAELIVVVEAAVQRMNIYGFNVPVGQIELVQQIDLAPLQRTAIPRAGAPRR
jgi:hypothetical protein